MYRRTIRRPLAVAAILIALAATLSKPNSQQVIAHQVNLAKDVGATLHIEPNDSPRAGEEVLAWFALTRKGGETIPLSNCSCTIEVYRRADQTTPIVSPAPQSVDSEGYQGIPGATFTFPEVGAYVLAISGSPKGGAKFSPFELAFEVTVAAGTSALDEASEPQSQASTASDSASDNASDSTPSEPPTEPLLEVETPAATPTVEKSAGETGKLIGIGAIGIGVLGAIALKYRRYKQP